MFSEKGLKHPRILCTIPASRTVSGYCSYICNSHCTKLNILQHKFSSDYGHSTFYGTIMASSSM